MDLLNSCLHYKPSHWDERNYSNNRFFRIKLDKECEEFKEVERTFLESRQSGPDKCIVEDIERVQHPFAYMRYQIRKEQLEVTKGVKPQTSRIFFAITDVAKIDKIIEFNCDQRQGGIHSFFLSNYTSTGYVIAIAVLDNDYDNRDSHRYPEYLIKFSYETDPNTLKKIDELRTLFNL